MLASCKIYLWKFNCKIPEEDNRNNMINAVNIVVHIFLCLSGEMLLGNASFGHPLGHIKNGSWAWNTSLPRARELTQPVPSFLPCMGTAFPVSDSCSLLCSAFKHMCQWSSDRPLASSVPGSTGWSPSATVLDVCTQTYCPTKLAGGRAGGKTHLQWGLAHTMWVDLILSVLRVKKSNVPCRIWLHFLFLDISCTWKQWAEAF